MKKSLKFQIFFNFSHQEQRPIPTIKDDQVLLRIDSVGICGSDVHYLVHGRIGDFIVNEPMIIGHESAGVVHQVGKSVKHLKVGDRVAIEPGVPCRYCDYCKNGKYNLCPDMVFCATPPVHGNLTRFYAHAADFCFKLPDHVTMEEASLLEPLSCGIHACKRGGVELGKKVLILGAGPIGLVTLLSAISMGSDDIIITDLMENRLKMAKELGAKHTLLVSKEMSVGEMVKSVHKTFGTEPDISIDCSGAESTTRMAILATKPGGCAVIIGMGPPEIKIPLLTGLVREIDIRGIFRYCNDYPSALAMAASGKMNLKKLITHHFDITETKQAFDTARYGRDGAIKVMIHCTPRDQNNPKKF